MKVIFILSILFSHINSFYSAQNDSAKAKSLSVIVMPFLENQFYPYDHDLIRDSFLRAFHRKGFNVIVDDSTWYVLLDSGLHLSQLYPPDLDTLAKIIDVDLVVYGYIQYTYYQRGFPSRQKMIKNPVQIRVYDANKKEIILRDNLYLTERRGWVYHSYTSEELGTYILRRLRFLNYDVEKK
jgi:hypothetical protein